MRQIIIACLLIATSCAAAPPPTQAPAAGVYRLGPGDKVRVVIFGEDKLGGEFGVDGAGRIALPLIGQLQVGGKTVDETQAAIVAKLAEASLRNPQVTVDVIDFRPVYILGEVNKPGEFPYSSGLTVYALVAKAGGFTYRANKRRVHVRHPDSAEIEITLDAATPVAPGDTIRIGERIF